MQDAFRSRGLDRALAAVLGCVCLVIAASGCTPVAGPDPTPNVAPVPMMPVALTPAPNVSGNPQNGRQLFTAKACHTCHYVQGAGVAPAFVGPNLTNIALRPSLANEALRNTPEEMARWIMDPPALKPGTLMPNLGVTDPEARDLAAFLYSLPLNPVGR